MCEYHGPLPRRRAADDGALPRLPALALARVEPPRLILLARRLNLRLAAGPLAAGLPDTAAGRLARARDCAASLIRLAQGTPPSPALLRPLLDGYAQRCGEAERGYWLDCAGDALNRAGLDAPDRLALWRWLDILSLRLLHARARTAGATVRHLHPPPPAPCPPACPKADAAHRA